MKSLFAILLLMLSGCYPVLAQAPQKGKPKVIRTLIVDGQNNHEQWPKITFMIKRYLEETGKFSVDVQRSYYTWNGDELIEKYRIPGVRATKALPKPRADSSFHPDFARYDLVVCNFGWDAAPWSSETQVDFDNFIKNGGGLVVIHAADNSFPRWPAYNKMIGLDGWGDRTEKDGPFVYYNNEETLIRDPQPGRAGSHGAQQEILIRVRQASHPITKGMPLTWMHTKDELYDRLRGPAEHLRVLAAAYSSKENKGTDRHEPMLMTINYGKGRIFHTPLGHMDYSVECVGFITCLQRGAQWAATGKVDIPIPSDFPTPTATSQWHFVEE